MKLTRNKRIKKILTKDFLKQEYIKNNKSSLVLSKELNISKRTILDYLIKFNITRNRQGQKKGYKRTLNSRVKQSNTLKKKKYYPNLSSGIRGKNNLNYKHGKYCTPNYCIDCGKEINCQSERCSSCARKHSIKKYGHPNKGKIFKHSGWRGKGQYYKEIWLRSSYEVAYAKYLDKNNIKWQYESKTFDLGNTTYTPDFYLPETNEYIEIKGWFTKEAKKKIKTFKNKYQDINFKILFKKDLQLICSLKK